MEIKEKEIWYCKWCGDFVTKAINPKCPSCKTRKVKFMKTWVEHMASMLQCSHKIKENKNNEKEKTIGEETRDHVCGFQANSDALKVLKCRHMEEYCELYDKAFKKRIKNWNK